VDDTATNTRQNKAEVRSTRRGPKEANWKEANWREAKREYARKGRRQWRRDRTKTTSRIPPKAA